MPETSPKSSWMHLSWSELVAEKRARLAARKGLRAFTEYTTPRWIAGRLHTLICEQLERIERGEIDRNRVWDWYTGTLYNRVRPGGAIVLIQHRMHEADLAGRLIERQKEGGDKWEIIRLPALTPEGALWPERYDIGALERIRLNTAPLKWS